MKTNLRTNPLNLIAAFVFVLLLLPVVHAAGQTTYGPNTAAFIKILSSDTFHLKFRIQGEDGKFADMEMFAKGGMGAGTVIGTYNRMITRDKKSYYINDPDKKMMVTAMDAESEGQNFAPAGTKYTGSGTADFFGKKLTYDEYTAPSGEKSWYFVDHGKLAGIRILDKDYANNGGSADVVVVALDRNIPPHTFDIPKGYKVESE